MSSSWLRARSAILPSKKIKVDAQQAATHIVGGPPDEVLLVQPGTVPKTASGKIRRAAARDLVPGKALETPQRAIWWQLTRLTFAGFGARFAQLRSATADLLYAAWWWTVIGFTFVAGWSMVMLLPRLTWRWAATWTLARGRQDARRAVAVWKGSIDFRPLAPS